MHLPHLRLFGLAPTESWEQYFYRELQFFLLHDQFLFFMLIFLPPITKCALQGWQDAVAISSQTIHDDFAARKCDVFILTYS